MRLPAYYSNDIAAVLLSSVKMNFKSRENLYRGSNKINVHSAQKWNNYVDTCTCLLKKQTIFRQTDTVKRKKKQWTIYTEVCSIFNDDVIIHSTLNIF